MRPVDVRWARIGSRNPSWMTHTPRAGLCLSVFIVARKGDSILLGRPRAHDAWPEKGGFPKRNAAEIEKEGAWLLPATHLLMEESPDHAASRVAHEWAGLKGKPRFVMVQSHVRPQRPGHPAVQAVREAIAPLGYLLRIRDECPTITQDEALVVGDALSPTH